MRQLQFEFPPTPTVIQVVGTGGTARLGGLRCHGVGTVTPPPRSPLEREKDGLRNILLGIFKLLGLTKATADVLKWLEGLSFQQSAPDPAPAR